MAIATRTDSVLGPNWSQVTLADAIKVAFTNAGYTAPFDEFVTGTDRFLVYQIVVDSTKTAGTAYLRIKITNTFLISQQMLSSWIVANKTGANGFTELNASATALVVTTGVNFTAINGSSEYKFVLIYQGANVLALGHMSPENRPAWWDLNAWSYVFFPHAANFASFRTTTLNPYGNADLTSSLNLAAMGVANSQTNRRDIVAGIIFTTPTNQGIGCRSSDDLVMVASSGASRFDTLQIPGDTKQYLLLAPVSGGLAVRTA